METATKKKAKRGTKKNNVTLREKKLANGNVSLYLDIYRDGSRTYEFLKLHINGKARQPLEKQQNTETYQLAENIRTQRESDLNHKTHGHISPAKKKVSYFDFAENYLTEYQKKDIRMIRLAVNRFKKFLAEDMPKVKTASLKITEIDKPMMLKFVDYLTDNSKGEGAHSCFQRFKKILKYAVEENIIAKSPADGVTCQIDKENILKDILDNSEIALLAKTPCQNLNIKRAFILSCCTGLRWCDVKALKYSDIDFASGKMTVDQQKTGQKVIVDLNPTAKKLIGEPGDPQTLVFELPSYFGCRKTVKAWVERAKIKKSITWHCARHSYGVNLLTSKQHPDIKTVSSLLGHSTLKHTEKYTRVVDELKKKAVNALPAYNF
ncbi:MAG: site-specific integrase [Prolixibacteraceae bacterium]|nr:site-specific integrase [Prolixibacteraceae bacterium]